MDGDGEEEGPKARLEVQRGLGIIWSHHPLWNDDGFGLGRMFEVERDGHDETIYSVHIRLEVGQRLEHSDGFGIYGPGDEGGVVTLWLFHVVQWQTTRPGGHTRGAQGRVRIVGGESVMVGVERRDGSGFEGGQSGVDRGRICGGGTRDPELEQVVVIEVPYDFGPVSYGVEVTHVLPAEMVPR